MDFATKISELADKLNQIKGHVQTEEATKSALVMPFLQALGYDVFNPQEVVPEYTADVGTKKGEKIDFAILRDEEPVMLIECKSCGTTLDQGKCNQLYRYFRTKPTARIGILTNGTRYMFFTDLEQPNIMDEKPFMELDLEHIDKLLLAELQKLTKDCWDIEGTMSGASELKYTRAIKRTLADEIQAPSEEFVRHFAARVRSGFITAKVREQFAPLIQRAVQQYINEQINERLESAKVEPVPTPSGEPAAAEQEAGETPRIVTTEEERDAYYIVKSILRETVDPKRVTMRDTQSYCGVLLEDNNRKPICRLHFNSSQKYLGLFDENKREERILIETIDDIYKHAERLKATVGYYEK